MLQYEIAGIKLDIIQNRSNDFERLKQFESMYMIKPDMKISFLLSGYFPVLKNLITKNDGIAWFTEVENDKISIYLYLKQTRRIEYKIETDKNWTNIAILYHKKSKWLAEEAFCSILGSFIMSNKILFYNGIVLHASSVDYFGKGIAFTAPSGTGKSTHTAMWQQYYNAAILNDDCPIVRYIDNQVNIYGTPWSGSENKSINSSSRLAAIIILERAAQNSIKELSNEDAVPLLLPRIFLPYQNPALMDIALQNAEKIIKNVPKYLLKCRPDKEATELVYRCIV